MALPCLLALVLLLSRSRLVHYAGLGLLFVQLAIHYAPYQIN
jgi:hypothetical protein